MALKKVKLNQIIVVTFIDIHTNNTGWIETDELMNETPALMEAVGFYKGETKDQLIALSTLFFKENDTNGARIYIPRGCIRDIKVLR